jgi:hypothetical protein
MTYKITYWLQAVEDKILVQYLPITHKITYFLQAVEDEIRSAHSPPITHKITYLLQEVEDEMSSWISDNIHTTRSHTVPA